MITRRLRNELTLKACWIGRNLSSTGSFVAKTRMLAIKPLSTKSPALWRVTLQPSKLFRTLYIKALLLSFVAIVQCPVEWPYQTALALVTGIGGVLIYRQTRQTQQLSLFEDYSWQIDDGCQSHQGRLSGGSYRSMLVVVVAIQPANGRTQYAVVWRDAVDPLIFSALHIQLALISSEQLL